MLQEAVPIMGSAQLGRRFNEEEGAALVAFRGSLTGEFPATPFPQPQR